MGVFILVYRIQKFCVHDGPGIRSTVFFRGCPLRCAWCHNPESWGDEAKGWRLPDLLAELEKDRVFYEESGGGVTLSGGEPLAGDLSYALELMLALKDSGISVVLDTCGDVPAENICKALPLVEMFLYDIKMLDAVKHAELTGFSNERILSNLAMLGRLGGRVCLRLPLLAGVNDSVEEAESIIAWLLKNDVWPFHVSLLPYHMYGSYKYKELGVEAPLFEAPGRQQLDSLLSLWEKHGYTAAIGGQI